MQPWPRSDYSREAQEQGLDPQTIDAILSLAETQAQNNVPPILTLNHLAWHTETPYKFLHSIVTRRADPYRAFQLRKRRGGFRVICVPVAPLLRVQRWINQHILQNARGIAPSPYATAYEPGSSPFLCAKRHVNCEWLIKVDVQRFFESISEIQIYRIFRKCGYQPLVALELARLCTRQTFVHGDSSRRREWLVRASRYTGTPGYRPTTLGHLPQGAATSPLLSNRAMCDFDSAIAAEAADRQLSFSRYSDDLIFSTSSVFSRPAAHELVARVFSIMCRFGLKPHTAKTVIAPPGARKVVLGLLVNTDAPRLPRDFKRRLECHIHYVCRHGLARHANKRGFTTEWGLARHIRGLVEYACMVEADFGEELRVRLKDALAPLHE